MLVQKITRGEVKVLDEEKGLVSAVASTEAKDRDGDIIRVDGWQLDNFMRNPVLLSSHNYGSLKAAIGKWESMEIKAKKLVGTARYFLDDGNEEAEAGFKLAKRGMAAFSVGFIPDMEKAEALKGGKGYEFKAQELLEVSQVLVPSNPTALQLARSVHQDPIVKELLDEELADYQSGTDADGNPTYSQQAIRAGLREIVREILAEIGTGSATASLGSGKGDAAPSSPEPDPVNILDILGVNNHA